MCVFCAPMTMEPDPAERERVLRRLAALDPDDPQPAGAAALLAWSSAPDPAAFFCDEAPVDPATSPETANDQRPRRFRSTECERP